MLVSEIKINVANLKSKIEEDYFTYKDMFSKVVVACLYLQICNNRELSPYIKLDAKEYDGLFKSLSYIGDHNRELLLYNLCLSETHISLLMDFNLYLDDFFRDGINKSYLNVISIDIDRTDFVTIKLKKLKLNKGNNIGHVN